MVFGRNGGARLLVYGHQTHQTHQAPDTFDVHRPTHGLQVPGHLLDTIKRRCQKLPVNLGHYFQVPGAFAHRFVVIARPAAHAILIVDQAGWHTTGKLEIPSNITLLPLPPRSPELNPVENIWQFMRENWLSSRIFKSYEEIVAICSEDWNKLIDQAWRIMSIGLRKWAHEY